MIEADLCVKQAFDVASRLPQDSRSLPYIQQFPSEGLRIPFT
jgi:hypothetical protein